MVNFQNACCEEFINFYKEKLHEKSHEKKPDELKKKKRDSITVMKKGIKRVRLFPQDAHEMRMRAADRLCFIFMEVLKLVFFFSLLLPFLWRDRRERKRGEIEKRIL